MSKKSRYKEGLSEIKDFRGDNQIRIVRSGRITYKSTEGYKNLGDMREAAVNDAIIILKQYAEHLSLNKINEIGEIVIYAQKQKNI